MKETSAGAIIFRIDKRTKKLKYLLLHYGAGHWDFVKGHVEKGETEKTTTAREAEEETEIKDLKFISGFREKINYFYRKEGKTIAKDVIFLLAQTEIAENKVKLSFEHVSFEWLPFAEAIKKVTYESSKNVLKKADRFLKKFLQQRRLLE